ncbi:MAG: hypothetical protein WC052_04335 [Patescibacteria group bacterium]
MSANMSVSASASHEDGFRRPALEHPLKCAWVVLVMLGRSYVPGAVVVAHAMRALRTRHSLVCMVTDDVPEESRAALRLVYDQVVEVPYIRHEARGFLSDRQTERYGSWLDAAFTKWNCLGLADYDRVLLVDADIVPLVNCDDLFGLRPPAACFSLPYLQPWKKKDGLVNPYIAAGESDLPHGTRIPAELVARSLRRRTVVGGGFLVLLCPSAADLAGYRAMLDAVTGPYGAAFQTKSGADEESIAEYFADRRGQDWTNIHQRYAAIPWKPNWVARDIRAYHYLGRKPWEMDPTEYPDLADWWRVARAASLARPQLASLFAGNAAAVAPLDAEAAELRITSDIRAMILANARENRRVTDWKARAEIDNILSRWLIAMVNSTRPANAWAHVYRATTAEDGFNNRLIGELTSCKLKLVQDIRDAASLVVRILSFIDKRLAHPPMQTLATLSTSASSISYGSHYKTEMTARLSLISAEASPILAARIAMRYDTIIVSGQQWAIPAAHVDHLYANFNVRREAFASALNSRLYGKDGAKYCSLFPDIEVGSLGSFFEQTRDDITGFNWIVNPPFIEDIMEKTARIFVDNMSVEKPQTVFFILPAWVDSAAHIILSVSPHLVAKKHLAPGSYVYEDPSGNVIDTKSASTYFIMSTDPLVDVGPLAVSPLAVTNAFSHLAKNTTS